MRLKTFRERAMQGVFFLTALASIAAVAVIFNVLWILYAPKQYAIYSTTRGCIVTRGPPAE